MIRLEKIDKYFGSHRVLSAVDLALEPGSVTALIGPSGSGKSTLLRCVNLLEIPEAGTLELGDLRVEFSRDSKPPRDTVLAIRRRTGMVFQNFQLFPHRTVIENVMEGLITVQKWDEGRARARAQDLRLAASISRDVLFLSNGVVVEAGPSRQIFTQPREKETANFVSTLTQNLPDAWAN
jgi:cystine transport system ATP-binding protein